MESMTELLANPMILATGGGGIIILFLALVFLLFSRRKKEQGPAEKGQLPEMSVPEGYAKPEEEPEEAEAQPEITEVTEDTKGESAVFEADPLEEVDVYINFGHFDQAAEILEWYLSENPTDTFNLLRYRDILAQMGDMERFIDAQERVCAQLGSDSDDCKGAILGLLQDDPENIDFRILAENCLGMDLEAVDEYLSQFREPEPEGESVEKAFEQEESEDLDFEMLEDLEEEDHEESLQKVQKDLEQKIMGADSLDMGGVDLAAFTDASKGIFQGAQDVGDPLVQTSDTLPLGEIESQERAVLRGFFTPIEESRALVDSGDLEGAISSLRRGILFEPRKLAYQVELLRLLLLNQKLEDYAVTLLSMYLTLWGAGRDLRLRFLDYGRQLGEHPIFNQLDEADKDNIMLGKMAHEWGLHVPLAAVPFANPPLVEEKLVTSAALVEEDSDDRILREFDQMLEYGQVEEAVGFLEEAVFSNPQELRYYHPLLEMYERMSDIDRFTKFSDAIMQQDPPPPEEGIRILIDVSNRLQKNQKRASWG